MCVVRVHRSGCESERGPALRVVCFPSGPSPGFVFGRHQQDSDLSVAHSDADLHRHKKKKKKKKRHSRKSEDFGRDSELRLPKAVSCETVDHFRRAEGTFPLADGLPLEGAAPFCEKTKHFRMESREVRCRLPDCGQGKGTLSQRWESGGDRGLAGSGGPRSPSLGRRRSLGEGASQGRAAVSLAEPRPASSPSSREASALRLEACGNAE